MNQTSRAVAARAALAFALGTCAFLLPARGHAQAGAARELRELMGAESAPPAESAPSPQSAPQQTAAPPQTAPAPSPAAPESFEEPAEPAPPPAPPSPDPHFHLVLSAGALHQAAPGFGLDGFRARFGFGWTPFPIRLDDWAFDAWIGAALGLGGWASDVVFELEPELGLTIRFGRFLGAYAGAWWVPGVVAARAAVNGTAGGWRAQIGAVLHPIRLGIGWQGVAIEGEFALHAYEAVIEWAL